MYEADGLGAVAQPIPGILDYVATKGAIVSFTKALANMLMSTNGIRTNCVNPGPIWTVREPLQLVMRVGGSEHPYRHAG